MSELRQDAGSDAAGEESTLDGLLDQDDLALLDTLAASDEDGDSGGDPGAGGGDEDDDAGGTGDVTSDIVGRVLKRFDGDEAALAKAYGELERKLGTQGRELGAARKRLSSFESESAKASKMAAAQELIGKVREAQADENQDPVEVLVAGLLPFLGVETGYDAASDEDEDDASGGETQVTRDRAEGLYETFLAANPSIDERLENLMIEVVKHQPEILPTQRGDEAFVRGLGMVLRKAQRLDTALKNRRRGKGGGLDTGRSTRFGRGVGSTRATRRRAFEKNKAVAMESGRTRDWARVVDQLIPE